MQKPTLVEENDNFYNFTSRDILEIGETASTLGSHEKKAVTYVQLPVPCNQYSHLC